MRNIKLIIEYDGSKYHGWQSQKNASAIHDVIQNAITSLVGEQIVLTGAGRTDAGVHAYGQTANFLTDSLIPPDKFCYALNNILPEDIVIRHSSEAEADFHSRFSAKGKKYRYLIYNSRFRSALMRDKAFHVAQPLDVNKMQEAALLFKGRHDFTAFMAMGGNSAVPVKTISDISLVKNEDIITFEISGDGFLYNMVRIISGTLIEVGLGRLSPLDIPVIIESRDRKNAGRTAPPHGLYLVKVYY